MFERIDAESTGFSTQRLQRISPWMEQYVDSGRLPGCLTAVMRKGKLAYLASAGLADPASRRVVDEHTVFRIYSMTKPIVSAAAMTFFEEGRFQLDDPVARFLPEFEHAQVWVDGEGEQMRTEAAEPIKIWHLMTHTAGLVYGARNDSPVGAMCRAAGIDFSRRNDATLADTVKALAKIPLRWQPGTRWEYSVATDVLGRLVEVLGGKGLDEVLQERIFTPLAMHHTGFCLKEGQLAHFAALFNARQGGGIELAEAADAKASHAREVTLFSGGGGLLSTVGDYLRFAEAIRCKGTLDGVRILGRHTVELMGINHLPANSDLAGMGTPVHSETSYEGIGFGLGFSVVLDQASAKAACSEGEIAWGGAASTAFWIDPKEELVVVFMTQLMPSSSYPIRRELRSLVYQALID